MRLNCPNCSAQYEVEDDVIPDQGRDVQCSNCGNTWYQKSAKQLEERPRSRPISRVVAPEPAPETDTSDDSAAQSDVSAENERQSLSPEVTDVLREEAAHEMAQRDAEVIETQTELGLDNRADETPPNLRERSVRLQELAEQENDAATAPSPANRKELLPDIEEINSTLEPNEMATGEVADGSVAIQARRSGFRRGFAFMIIIFAVMMLVYVFAPQIVAWNIATEPYLSGYVDWINNLRSSADSFMANSADRLSQLLNGINAE